VGRLVDDLSRPSTRPTLKALRQLNIDQLRTVVDRRPGDDELVELSLLAGSSTYHAEPDQLLEAHSDPGGALLTLTRELRRRLGGNPEDRCRWIRFVLRSRWCTEEVVTALPAHAAMAVVTPARQEQPNPIVTMIRARLGDHAGAWQRFAANPATKTERAHGYGWANSSTPPSSAAPGQRRRHGADQHQCRGGDQRRC
jgi:hypothetical protein